MIIINQKGFFGVPFWCIQIKKWKIIWQKFQKMKIKSIDYLFNRIISERVRDSMEPKYSLLMGAGCSVSSQIVSAKDIINMLKTIVYLRGTSDRRYTNTIFGLEYGKLVPFLKRWYAKKIRIMRSLQNCGTKEQQIQR